MNQLRTVPLAALLGLILPVLASAQTEFFIDFGSSGFPSGVRTVVWNDIDTTNVSATHALVDGGGNASNLQLDFTPGKELVNEVALGTLTPAPGSPMALLGWPATALQDTLWNDWNAPEAEFVLSGLDPDATYDFRIAASRIGASDVRSAEYVAEGFNTVHGVLDAGNNDSQIVSLMGVVPDALQTIRFHMRADPSNTNPQGFYYLGGIDITENTAAAAGPLIVFAENPLSVSRRAGNGPFSADATVLELDAATPALLITAVDDATLLAPTWLSLPINGFAGTPFSISVDESAVVPGSYSATVTVQAAGYQDATLGVTLDAHLDDGSLNLLYYGNSYIFENGGVDALVDLIAGEAGFTGARIVERTAGGVSLAFHLTEPLHAATVTNGLLVGEEWDYVVMQGSSLEATVLGDPAAFQADAEAIFASVKAHSPDARACMFQTWARGQGHFLYTGPPIIYPNPIDFHREVEANYIQAVANMNATFGPDSARRAAAGEAAALLNFDPAIYGVDLSHPLPELSLLASMAVFQAIYETRVCDLTPDFGGAGALVTELQSLGLDEEDWRELSGIGERVAAPNLRRLPGSGDDLLLRTGTLSSGFETSCSLKRVRPRSTQTLTIESPASTLVGAPAMIFAQVVHGASLPNPSPLFPELHVDSTLSFAALSLGALPAGPNGAVYNVPPIPLGMSVVVQGQVLAPSFYTGNAFTTTDAHELRSRGGVTLSGTAKGQSDPAPGRIGL